MKRGLGWMAVALICAFLTTLGDPGAVRGERGSFVSRLLGPVRTVASNVQWVRFDLARRSGEFDLAYGRAETALRLDPNSTGGWLLLSHHLAFDRGSPGAASLEDRRTWLRAGLEILERGKAFVRHPEELEFTQGTYLAAQASYEPADVVWPGGAKAALHAAAEHFRRAGKPEFAESALELAEETE